MQVQFATNTYCISVRHNGIILQNIQHAALSEILANGFIHASHRHGYDYMTFNDDGD